MKPIPLALLIALTTSATSWGDCRAFFHHRQAIVQHAYAQPIIQQLYFSVGDNLRIEAYAEKAAEKKFNELLAQQKGGTLQQRQSVLAEKCARCHQGESAKGGIDLTGELDDSIFRRSMEILAGQDVPDAMKGVVAGLKDGDHAAIMSEMLARKPKAGVLR